MIESNRMLSAESENDSPARSSVNGLSFIPANGFEGDVANGRRDNLSKAQWICISRPFHPERRNKPTAYGSKTGCISDAPSLMAEE
jgi:hypothetical protein